MSYNMPSKDLWLNYTCKPGGMHAWQAFCKPCFLACLWSEGVLASKASRQAYIPYFSLTIRCNVEDRNGCCSSHIWKHARRLHNDKAELQREIELVIKKGDFSHLPFILPIFCKTSTKFKSVSSRSSGSDVGFQLERDNKPRSIALDYWCGARTSLSRLTLQSRRSNPHGPPELETFAASSTYPTCMFLMQTDTKSKARHYTTVIWRGFSV